MLHASPDEDDLFWAVQLSGDASTSRTSLTSGAARAEFEDHALAVGTELTTQSLAEVLGSENEVAVPIATKHSKDGDGREDVPDSLDRELVLRLRQVNGNGIMSGVGGEIWCAALLLSAWLLHNPSVIQGLNVLELGSGLGLCGITAGYLAKSVIFTDYIDELLVNLEHNIASNSTPEIKLKSVGCRNGAPMHAIMADHGKAADRQQDQRISLQPLSNIRVRKLDWTAYDGDGSARESCETDGDWWDDRGPGADSDTRGNEDVLAPSDTLQCDVVIGSALIYSPHHACVGDVLARAFAKGGCGAAHIVQLSTRPGFDDFLRRLRPCGLRYRLQRMSAVLPAVLLSEIRRRIPATGVGGPVNDAGTCGGGVCSSDAETTGFEEFVLCSIFRLDDV